MPTIQQQINQLKKDKETLNTMLNTMGVETTGNETFTQLTPLVGKIVTDPILQDKTIEIVENGTTNITADEGYDGLNNVEVITNVAGSGGGDQETGLVERTLTNYTNANATRVWTYAFYEADNLISVNFPKATTISNYAFYRSGNLTTVKAPSMTYVGHYAFAACTSLKTIEAPNLKDVTASSFSSCKALTSVDFPSVTEISGGNSFENCTLLETVNLPSLEIISGQYAFQKCSALKTVDCPNLTTTSSYTYYNCSSLENVNLPKVTSVGRFDFSNCTNLPNITLPEATAIAVSGFQNCTNLAKVDLYKATNINNDSFLKCTSLETLIIRTETKCTCTGTSFKSTPIASGTGYVYVPRALINTYLEDGYWSNYSNQIRAIEDYPEICG